MPLAAIAAIGAIGSIGGAAIGAHAAGSAANTQAQAANNAAQLQYQASQNALDYQNKVFDYQKGVSAPFVQAGQGAVQNLSYLLGIPQEQQQPGAAPQVQGTQQPQSNPYQYGNSDQPMYGPSYGQRGGPMGYKGDPAELPYAPVDRAPTTATAQPTAQPFNAINPSLGGYGSLMKNPTFTAPTDVTEQNDPGYQFRLDQGMKALERSSAARGDVFSGGTAKALTRYGQDYASNEYGNVYGRAMDTYNIARQGQIDQYNRLAGAAGLGQQSSGQIISAGNNSANNVSSNLLGTASAMGNDYQNAAAARASGYVGTSNAINSGINGVTNSLLLNQLLKQPSAQAASASGIGVYN